MSRAHLEPLHHVVAQRRGAELHKGALRGYALIAAPRFLGTLRAQLSSRASEEPYATVDKNVVNQGADVIGKLLDEA